MNKNDIKSGIIAIIGFIKPYKYHVIAMIFSLCISSSSVLLMSQGLRYFIDVGLVNHDASMLNYSILYLMILIIIMAFATAARVFFVNFIGEKVVADLRKAIHFHLLTLSPSFFETRKPGEILSHLTNDIATLQGIVGSGMSIAMRNIVMIIGALSILLVSNTKLTLIVLLAIPLVIIPIIILGKKTRNFTKVIQTKIANITALSSEVIQNIKLIQSYTQEEYEKNKFEHAIEDELSTSLFRIKMRSINTVIIMILVFSSVILILWIGGGDVLSGTITAGQLSSFIFLAVLTASSITNLMEVITNLQKAAGISQGLTEFLAIKSEIFSEQNAISINEKYAQGYNESFQNSCIIFKNVTFSYPSRLNNPAIYDMNLSIEKNKITALVGKSGAGKSTIINLMMRFYDVTQGTIYYKGENIKNLKLDELRQEFGYVSQEQLTFADTIYNNIIYGRLDATKNEVIEAAKLASAFNFIEKLPDGFNTIIGEKGIRLSGGQRQRISIARAFLKNPKILLLDEATSSLDQENEAKVQKAITRLMKNRTCIVIAHRLSTIKNADRILFIADGQIIEQGTHDELINKNGYYAKLYGINKN